MSRKEALLQLLKLGKEKNQIGMVLLITKHKDYPEAEIIAVPKANFELKAQYISAQYTEDLVLASCKDIKIVGVKVLDNIGGIING